MSSLVLQPQPSFEELQHTAAQVQQLLMAGHRLEALRQACSMRLYSITRFSCHLQSSRQLYAHVLLEGQCSVFFGGPSCICFCCFPLRSFRLEWCGSRAAYARFIHIWVVTTRRSSRSTVLLYQLGFQFIGNLQGTSAQLQILNTKVVQQQNKQEPMSVCSLLQLQQQGVVDSADRHKQCLPFLQCCCNHDRERMLMGFCFAQPSCPVSVVVQSTAS